LTEEAARKAASSFAVLSHFVEEGLRFPPNFAAGLCLALKADVTQGVIAQTQDVAFIPQAPLHPKPEKQTS
jgi:hypothetical protein